MTQQKHWCMPTCSMAGGFLPGAGLLAVRRPGALGSLRRATWQRAGGMRSAPGQASWWGRPRAEWSQPLGNWASLNRTRLLVGPPTCSLQIYLDCGLQFRLVRGTGGKKKGLCMEWCCRLAELVLGATESNSYSFSVGLGVKNSAGLCQARSAFLVPHWLGWPRVVHVKGGSHPAPNPV